jgi:hypothetical protein
LHTMHWYNPTKRVEEDVPAPVSEAQAIGMLSWHPNSDEFIEEYRRKRMSSGIVEALIFTGETFYQEHRRERLPE